MVYVIAKTKKGFALHKFKNVDEFMVWLHDCVCCFGNVVISNLEVDSK